jgi:hypothetical protein
MGSFYKSHSTVLDAFEYEPEFDKIVESFRFIDVSDNNQDRENLRRQDTMPVHGDG